MGKMNRWKHDGTYTYIYIYKKEREREKKKKKLGINDPRLRSITEARINHIINMSLRYVSICDPSS